MKPADNVVAFSGNTMVFESIKRHALDGLNELIRVLMENVDDSLFELSDKVDNDRERNMYFDAMRQIRLKRKAIEDNFNQQLHQSFNALIMQKAPVDQPQDLDELTLIDQDDMECKVAIDNMINKARPQFEDDLFALSERLKTILHRKHIDEDLNPLDPKAICTSFHRASEELDADIEIKLIFYKLFDKFVISQLGEYYRHINRYFIDKGVLPDFKAFNARVQQSSRFKPRRDKSAADSEPQSSARAGQDPSMAGSASSAGEVPAEASLFSSLQQAMFPSASVVAEPSAGVIHNPVYINALTSLQASSEQALGVDSNTDPQLYKTELQQQLSRFKQQQQAGEAENQVIDIISMLFDFFFDDDKLPAPIKVLIGRLQIPILKVATLDQGFFNSKKHPARRLLDSISKASLGWTADGGEESFLVEKIEQIVDFLLTEFDQDIALFEQALEQLQQFLLEEKQKAEENLQQLQQQEQQKEQRIREARQLTDELLTKLLSKYDLSFNVIEFFDGIWKQVLFKTCLTQGADSGHWRNLKKISSTLIWTLIPKNSEQEKQKLLRTLPPLLRALAKGMELVHFDKQDQNQVFEMLVQEHSTIVKQTSKNIVTRVDEKTVWPEDKVAASLAGFNTSKDDAEQDNLLLQEERTGEMQMIDLASEQDSEQDALEQISRSQTTDVIRNLEDFTDSIINGRIKIDEEIVLDSVESSMQMAEEDADEYYEQAQALQIGQWVEFTDAEGQLQNAELSWKSNVTGKYVFVNRHGIKVRNTTVHGFAAELRGGRARLIETVSVFDRAIESLMQRMRPQTATA